MEGSSVAKKCLLVFLFAALVVAKEVSAAQHVVGGSQGWDQSTDFGSWASGETFKVGDELVFKYSSMHSVVELNGESAYKSCDIGTAVDSMNGGKNVVKLTEPGTRYFACGTMGHCDGGMKVKITTVSADGSSPPSSSSPSSSSSSPSSSSSTPTTTSAIAASAFCALNPFIYMAALFLGSLLFNMF